MTSSKNAGVMDGIAHRLDPSPKLDAGHYVAVPVGDGAKTLKVADGQKLSRIFIIGNGHAGQKIDGVENVASLPFDNLVVGSDADLNIVFLILPGVSVDVPLVADIVGKNSKVSLSGLYLCGGKDRVRLLTEVRHREPSSVSNQLFNGVAAGESKVDFFGKIIVAPQAQKTEAYQVNHNIVLSQGAHAEARPQLEIYADDVKCSHGATVGQLNEDEQFYMRSRGIPQEVAKVLQMVSFIAPVLSSVEDEDCRTALTDLVESALRNL